MIENKNPTTLDSRNVVLSGANLNGIILFVRGEFKYFVVLGNTLAF